jgi:hypothetical protein
LSTVERVLLTCERSDFEDYIEVMLWKLGKEIIKNAYVSYPEEFRKFYPPQDLILEMHEKLWFAMYGTQKQLILAQPEDYLLIVILDNFVEA